MEADEGKKLYDTFESAGQPLPTDKTIYANEAVIQQEENEAKERMSQQPKHKPNLKLKLHPDQKATRDEMLPRMKQQKIYANGKMTILYLKKYICQQFPEVNIEEVRMRVDLKIDIKCKNQNINEQHNLEYVNKILWNEQSTMVLQYKKIGASQ